MNSCLDTGWYFSLCSTGAWKTGSDWVTVRGLNYMAESQLKSKRLTVQTGVDELIVAVTIPYFYFWFNDVLEVVLLEMDRQCENK